MLSSMLLWLPYTLCSVDSIYLYLFIISFRCLCIVQVISFEPNSYYCQKESSVAFTIQDVGLNIYEKNSWQKSLLKPSLVRFHRWNLIIPDHKRLPSMERGCQQYFGERTSQLSMLHTLLYMICYISFGMFSFTVSIFTIIVLFVTVV